MSASAVTARLEELEARIQTENVNAWLAMLVAELDGRGWKIQPPVYRGARWRFTTPDGARVSLSALLELGRVDVVLSATCNDCEKEIPLSAWRRQERGPRIDRRYCSNACRQRAYRERRATP